MLVLGYNDCLKVYESRVDASISITDQVRDSAPDLEKFKAVRIVTG